MSLETGMSSELMKDTVGQHRPSPFHGAYRWVPAMRWYQHSFDGRKIEEKAEIRNVTQEKVSTWELRQG